MKRLTAEVEGLDSLMRKLDQLPEAIGEKVQRQILMDAGEIIAELARDLVPVDTGDLRGSITVSDTIVGYDGQGLTLGLGGTVTVYIGPQRNSKPDGWYGHLVEYGTIKMAAQPFMRPAFDSTKGQVQSRIRNDLAAAIAKAAKG
ncbi:HK97-gp10 family putative phage morphogenesis protein [Sphingomonas sanxanigenens]|uniref:HK97 gp10 family phage protein n=1 Tax=Sphingomonas sanxanigenens DSM 19645 = NX02 TaxID=1123269 RepID=W0AHY0_9SPHN|nr:HK97-gp10 family putative phage morphogenesis protein [Sphingomonas sanxanigenens]AHE55908.1 hypothetical protein NX02_21380 [Sphingomonas sanxanigenens DSM 19645 = NX02]